MDFIKESSSVESSSTDCKSKSPISKDLDKNKSLRQFCKLYPKKIKITHIIINPIRNKLDLLSDQVKGNVDILMISETKIAKTLRHVNSKLMDLIHLFELIWPKMVVT